MQCYLQLCGEFRSCEESINNLEATLDSERISRLDGIFVCSSTPLCNFNNLISILSKERFETPLLLLPVPLCSHTEGKKLIKKYKHTREILPDPTCQYEFRLEECPDCFCFGFEGAGPSAIVVTEIVSEPVVESSQEISSNARCCSSDKNIDALRQASQLFQSRPCNILLRIDQTANKTCALLCGNVSAPIVLEHLPDNVTVSFFQVPCGGSIAGNSKAHREPAFSSTRPIVHSLIEDFFINFVEDPSKLLRALTSHGVSNMYSTIHSESNSKYEDLVQESCGRKSRSTASQSETNAELFENKSFSTILNTASVSVHKTLHSYFQTCNFISCFKRFQMSTKACIVAYGRPDMEVIFGLLILDDDTDASLVVMNSSSLDIPVLCEMVSNSSKINTKMKENPSMGVKTVHSTTASNQSPLFTQRVHGIKHEMHLTANTTAPYLKVELSGSTSSSKPSELQQVILNDLLSGKNEVIMSLVSQPMLWHSLQQGWKRMTKDDHICAGNAVSLDTYLMETILDKQDSKNKSLRNVLTYLLGPIVSNQLDPSNLNHLISNERPDGRKLAKFLMDSKIFDWEVVNVDSYFEQDESSFHLTHTRTSAFAASIIVEKFTSTCCYNGERIVGALITVKHAKSKNLEVYIQKLKWQKKHTSDLALKLNFKLEGSVGTTLAEYLHTRVYEMAINKLKSIQLTTGEALALVLNPLRALEILQCFPLVVHQHICRLQFDSSLSIFNVDQRETGWELIDAFIMTVRPRELTSFTCIVCTSPGRINNIELISKQRFSVQIKRGYQVADHGVEICGECIYKSSNNDILKCKLKSSAYFISETLPEVTLMPSGVKEFKHFFEITSVFNFPRPEYDASKCTLPLLHIQLCEIESFKSPSLTFAQPNKHLPNMVVSKLSCGARGALRLKFDSWKLGKVLNYLIQQKYLPDVFGDIEERLDPTVTILNPYGKVPEIQLCVHVTAKISCKEACDVTCDISFVASKPLFAENNSEIFMIDITNPHVADGHSQWSVMLDLLLTFGCIFSSVVPACVSKMLSSIEIRRIQLSFSALDKKFQKFEIFCSIKEFEIMRSNIATKGVFIHLSYSRDQGLLIGCRGLLSLLGSQWIPLNFSLPTMDAPALIKIDCIGCDLSLSRLFSSSLWSSVTDGEVTKILPPATRELLKDLKLLNVSLRALNIEISQNQDGNLLCVSKALITVNVIDHLNFENLFELDDVNVTIEVAKQGSQSDSYHFQVTIVGILCKCFHIALHYSSQNHCFKGEISVASFEAEQATARLAIKQIKAGEKYCSTFKNFESWSEKITTLVTKHMDKTESNALHDSLRLSHAEVTFRHVQGMKFVLNHVQIHIIDLLRDSQKRFEITNLQFEYIAYEDHETYQTLQESQSVNGKKTPTDRIKDNGEDTEDDVEESQFEGQAMTQNQGSHTSETSPIMQTEDKQTISDSEVSEDAQTISDSEVSAKSEDKAQDTDSEMRLKKRAVLTAVVSVLDTKLKLIFDLAVLCSPQGNSKELTCQVVPMDDAKPLTLSTMIEIARCTKPELPDIDLPANMFDLCIHSGSITFGFSPFGIKKFNLKLSTAPNWVIYQSPYVELENFVFIVKYNSELENACDVQFECDLVINDAKLCLHGSVSNECVRASINASCERESGIAEFQSVLKKWPPMPGKPYEVPKHLKLPKLSFNLNKISLNILLEKNFKQVKLEVLTFKQWMIDFTTEGNNTKQVGLEFYEMGCFLDFKMKRKITKEPLSEGAQAEAQHKPQAKEPANTLPQEGAGKANEPLSEVAQAEAQHKPQAKEPANKLPQEGGGKANLTGKDVSIQGGYDYEYYALLFGKLQLKEVELFGQILLGSESCVLTAFICREELRYDLTFPSLANSFAQDGTDFTKITPKSYVNKLVPTFALLHVDIKAKSLIVYAELKEFARGILHIEYDKSEKRVNCTVVLTLSEDFKFSNISKSLQSVDKIVKISQSRLMITNIHEKMAFSDVINKIRESIKTSCQDCSSYERLADNSKMPFSPELNRTMAISKHDRVRSLMRDVLVDKDLRPPEALWPFDQDWSSYTDKLKCGFCVYAEFNLKSARNTSVLIRNTLDLTTSDSDSSTPSDSRETDLVVIVRCSNIMEASKAEVSFLGHINYVELTGWLNFKDIDLSFKVTKSKELHDLMLKGILCVQPKDEKFKFNSLSFKGSLAIFDNKAEFEAKSELKLSEVPFKQFGIDPNHDRPQMIASLSMLVLYEKEMDKEHFPPPFVIISGNTENLFGVLSTKASITLKGTSFKLLRFHIDTDTDLLTILRAQLGDISLEPGLLKLHTGQLYFCRCNKDDGDAQSIPLPDVYHRGELKKYRKGLWLDCDVSLFGQRFLIETCFPVSGNKFDLRGGSRDKITLFQFLRLTNDTFFSGPQLRAAKSKAGFELSLIIGIELWGEPWFFGILSFKTKVGTLKSPGFEASIECKKTILDRKPPKVTVGWSIASGFEILGLPVKSTLNNLQSLKTFLTSWQNVARLAYILAMSCVTVSIDGNFKMETSHDKVPKTCCCIFVWNGELVITIKIVKIMEKFIEIPIKLPDIPIAVRRYDPSRHTSLFRYLFDCLWTSTDLIAKSIWNYICIENLFQVLKKTVTQTVKRTIKNVKNFIKSIGSLFKLHRGNSFWVLDENWNPVAYCAEHESDSFFASKFGRPLAMKAVEQVATLMLSNMRATSVLEYEHDDLDSESIITASSISSEEHFKLEKCIHQVKHKVTQLSDEVLEISDINIDVINTTIEWKMPKCTADSMKISDLEHLSFHVKVVATLIVNPLTNELKQVAIVLDKIIEVKQSDKATPLKNVDESFILSLPTDTIDLSNVYCIAVSMYASVEGKVTVLPSSVTEESPQLQSECHQLNDDTDKKFRDFKDNGWTNEVQIRGTPCYAEQLIKQTKSPTVLPSFHDIAYNADKYEIVGSMKIQLPPSSFCTVQLYNTEDCTDILWQSVVEDDLSIDVKALPEGRSNGPYKLRALILSSEDCFQNKFAISNFEICRTRAPQCIRQQTIAQTRSDTDFVLFSWKEPNYFNYGTLNSTEQEEHEYIYKFSAEMKETNIVLFDRTSSDCECKCNLKELLKQHAQPLSTSMDVVFQIVTSGDSKRLDSIPHVTDFTVLAPPTDVEIYPPGEDFGVAVSWNFAKKAMSYTLKLLNISTGTSRTIRKYVPYQMLGKQYLKTSKDDGKKRYEFHSSDFNSNDSEDSDVFVIHGEENKQCRDHVEEPEDCSDTTALLDYDDFKHILQKKPATYKIQIFSSGDGDKCIQSLTSCDSSDDDKIEILCSQAVHLSFDYKTDSVFVDVQNNEAFSGGNVIELVLESNSEEKSSQTESASTKVIGKKVNRADSIIIESDKVHTVFKVPTLSFKTGSVLIGVVSSVSTNPSKGVGCTLARSHNALIVRAPPAKVAFCVGKLSSPEYTDTQSSVVAIDSKEIFRHFDAKPTHVYPSPLKLTWNSIDDLYVSHYNGHIIALWDADVTEEAEFVVGLASKKDLSIIHHRTFSNQKCTSIDLDQVVFQKSTVCTLFVQIAGIKEGIVTSTPALSTQELCCIRAEIRINTKWEFSIISLVFHSSMLHTVYLNSIYRDCISSTMSMNNSSTVDHSPPKKANTVIGCQLYCYRTYFRMAVKFVRKLKYSFAFLYDADTGEQYQFSVCQSGGSSTADSQGVSELYPEPSLSQPSIGSKLANNYHSQAKDVKLPVDVENQTDTPYADRSKFADREALHTNGNEEKDVNKSQQNSTQAKEKKDLYTNQSKKVRYDHHHNLLQGEDLDPDNNQPKSRRGQSDSKSMGATCQASTQSERAKSQTNSQSKGAKDNIDGKSRKEKGQTDSQTKEAKRQDKSHSIGANDQTGDHQSKGVERKADSRKKEVIGRTVGQSRGAKRQMGSQPMTSKGDKDGHLVGKTNRQVNTRGQSDGPSNGARDQSGFNTMGDDKTKGEPKVEANDQSYGMQNGTCSHSNKLGSLIDSQSIAVIESESHNLTESDATVSKVDSELQQGGSDLEQVARIPRPIDMDDKMSTSSIEDEHEGINQEPIVIEDQGQQPAVCGSELENKSEVGDVTQDEIGGKCWFVLLSGKDTLTRQNKGIATYIIIIA